MRLLVFWNTYLATPAVFALLLFGGLWLFFSCRGEPFLHFFRWFFAVFGRKKAKTGGQNPFRALCVALAGTLGVGNIVGVATAVHLGGAGALFWMWVSALFAAVLKYAETVLAVSFGASPMQYMLRGLGAKKTAVTFAVLCLVSSLFLGNALQTLAVTETMEVVFSLPPLVTSFCFAVPILFVTIGGISRISEVTVRLIPALTLLFLIGACGILVQYRALLPAVFARIFREAFSLSSMGSGIGGYLLFRGMKFGTMRGLLSNEAGCGTAPMAHATAEGTSPAEQGFWGILEVFIDTIVLCTASGLVFLLFPDLVANSDGMTLALAAFRRGYGVLSDYLLAGSVLLFALASVLSWSYYGTTALGFLVRAPRTKTAYLAVYGLTSAFAPLLPAAALWELTDLGIAAMTVLNTLCVLRLRRVVVSETRSFAMEHRR